MRVLASRNPATGELIQEVPCTEPSGLKEIFTRARTAQQAWSQQSPRRRAAVLRQLREVLLSQLDECAGLISRETGKPRFEALINDLLPSVETLTFFARRAPRLLKDQRIPLHLMKHRRSVVNYWPLGVVVIISPWNYPFLLPFADIVMALAAGNAVVFKPSEVTPLVGLKIQEICDLAGLPPDLMQTVIGDGTLGAALIRERPDKIFFTGSVPTGKKVMAAASEQLIPVNLELGGKDAMIVLKDADLDFATSAALWGGYSNSGQACASIERVLVHESIAAQFEGLLKEKLAKLRQGDPDSWAVDLGCITYEKQKAVYASQLKQARDAEARFVTGGEFSDDRRYLQPTVVSGPSIEQLDVYREETFGPVVAITTFKSIAEAVQKANESRYGLMASIITRDLTLAESIARQLHVGGVMINEVLYSAGLPETPWGGVKETGFGRTHSEMGLYEFVNVRHIHRPRSRWLTFKSFWWFPYTPFQYATFRSFFELYRRSRLDRLRAVPIVLWNFLQMWKNEPRI